MAHCPRKSDFFRLLFLSLSMLLVVNYAFFDGSAQVEEYRSVETETMKIALTFDDGPHPHQTKEILEILDTE